MLPFDPSQKKELSTYTQVKAHGDLEHPCERTRMYVYIESQGGEKWSGACHLHAVTPASFSVCSFLVAVLLLVTRGVGPIKDLLPLWLLALPLSIYVVWQSIAAAKFLYSAAKYSAPLSKMALDKASKFQQYAQSGSLMESVSEMSGNARRELMRKQETIIGDAKGKQQAWTEYVTSGKLVEDVKVEFQRRAAEQAGSVYDGVLTTYESVVDWWSPNRRRLQLLLGKLF